MNPNTIDFIDSLSAHQLLDLCSIFRIPTHSTMPVGPASLREPKDLRNELVEILTKAADMYFYDNQA